MAQLARGSVSDRPWGMTLGALGMRGLTGEVTLTSDGKEYRVAFFEGAVVGAHSPLVNDAAVRLALTTNLITSTQVADITRRMAAARDRDELEVLAELARIPADQVSRLRRRLIAQRAARTLQLDRGEFVVDDEITIPVWPEYALDVRAVVYMGAKNNMTEDRLGADLRLFGGWFQLKPDAMDDLPQYGFTETEKPVLRMLIEGANLGDMELTNPELGARGVRAITYALVTCTACTAEPARASAVQAPPPPAAPPPGPARPPGQAAPAMRPPGQPAPAARPPGQPAPATRPTPNPAGAPPARPTPTPAPAAPPVRPTPTPAPAAAPVRPTPTPAPAAAPVRPTPTPAPAAAPVRPTPAPAPAAAAPAPEPDGGLRMKPAGGRAAPAPRRAKRNSQAISEIQQILADKVPQLDQGLDHYSLLGVTMSATSDQIRKTYFDLARKLHPDRLQAIGASDEVAGAQRLMAQINTAFATLNDAKKRAEYDSVLMAGGEDALRAQDAQADEMAMRVMQAEEAFKQGEMALRRDQIPLALQQFQIAVELQPNEPEFQAMLAWAQFAAAPDKNAVAGKTRRALQTAADANSKSVTPLFYLGRVERILGKEREALQYFQQVLAINPRHPEAGSEARLLEQRLKGKR